VQQQQWSSLGRLGSSSSLVWYAASAIMIASSNQIHSADL